METHTHTDTQTKTYKKNTGLETIVVFKKKTRKKIYAKTKHYQINVGHSLIEIGSGAHCG